MTGKDSSMDRGRDRQAAVRLAPGVQWVVETDGVVLIRPGSRALRLTGVSAALWALAASGRDQRIIRDMMTAISGQTPETTAATMERLLVLWEEKGYLVPRCPNG